LPDIGLITQSLIDRMGVSGALNSIPQNQQRPFSFSADFLHDRIEKLLPRFVQDIRDQYRGDIEQIFARNGKTDLPSEPVGHPREARWIKSQRHRDRYKVAGEYLNEMRRIAAEAACSPPGKGTPVDPTAPDPADADSEALKVDFELPFNPTVAAFYRKELRGLLLIDEQTRAQIQCSRYPVSLSLAFIMCSLSRPALRLARSFLPLPCEKTIQRYFRRRIGEQESNLEILRKIPGRVELS
jgi:hypothetical protein